MANSKKLLTGWMALLLSLSFLSGCGDVSERPGDLNRLKVLELLPQDLEEVPQNMTAIVVFNDQVSFDGGAANVNGSTFYLEKDAGGMVSGFTVEKSEPDTQEATALITLPDPSPLEAGATYHVVVEGTIKGKNTDPLGTQMRNKFTVQ